MPSPATDVFLSYKAEDRARLAPLVNALEAEGFTVWWDAFIGGGINWHEDIERHLDAAKCVIVAWSKRSVGHDGHFVRDEARRAQRRDVYVPVCLDLVEPPLGFGEVQALSLKSWKGDRSDPRFQAVADAVRRQISGGHTSPRHFHFHEPQMSRRVVLGVSAGVAAIAGASGWFLLRSKPANATRIAVLPFANLSGAEDQAYFAEGISEELRSALSRIGLQVIGRASSDAVKDLDTKAAASKLGVSNILTGSVRRSAQMVRINAQLVDGRDGVERWAQSYDRVPGDEIKIQTDIAANVAQALSIALGQAGHAALTLGGTADSAAQDLFLRARTLYRTTAGENNKLQCLALVDAAIARDPKYAEGYRLKALILMDLAQSYPDDTANVIAKVAQAEKAARRAIAIEPKLGSAYVPLALVEASRFNFRDALRDVQRALALSPEDFAVLLTSSIYMQTFGDGHRALDIADRALALDPLQGANHARRAKVLISLREYPQALAASRRALKLAPKLSHFSAASCYVLMNRRPEAKAEFQKMPRDDPSRLTGEAILAARSGDLAGVKRTVARMSELFGATFGYQYAEIYAQARDANRAFAELDNAVRAKDPGIMGLKCDPFLDPIVRDPRYAALLKRLNFPTWT